jgi:hypothetical protein
MLFSAVGGNCAAAAAFSIMLDISVTGPDESVRPTGNTPGKKPPARSVTTKRPDLKAQIADEICTALERLGADDELLAIVSGWRDTLDDAEALVMLREYNATGKVLQRPQ